MSERSTNQLQNKTMLNVTGILISNLGSPDKPTKKSLRHYLKQFLSDKFVIQPPPSRFIWLCILHLVILNIRPARSAKKYQKIWHNPNDKAPLIKLCESLLSRLENTLVIPNKKLQFALGMRYGNPSIPSAIKEFQLKGCSEIIILPLYPQFSNTTTESTRFEIEKSLSNWVSKPKIFFIDNYHDNDLYIDTLASSIHDFQLNNDKPDKLIISYHSIPQRYVDNGDLYYDHCRTTTDLLVAKLGLNDDEYELCFQSIFGREKWIGPDISTRLAILGKGTSQSVQVVCPGFPVDCLETLEEIEMDNKEVFLSSGGQKFDYIPALNDHKSHASLLANIIENQSR